MASKMPFSVVHPAAAEHIDANLQAAFQATELAGTLFRAVKNNMHDGARTSITPDGVYQVLRVSVQPRHLSPDRQSESSCSGVAAHLCQK
jgi:hypothetical protein